MPVMQCVFLIICTLIFAALHTFVSLEYDELKYISPKTLQNQKGYSKRKAWVLFFMILILTPFIIPSRLIALWLERIQEIIERREQFKELSPEEERFIDELMREMEDSERK